MKLQDGTLRLLLSTKEGQNVDPKKKTEWRKQHQDYAFWLAGYLALNAQAR
jgi:hypothetical protein